MQDFVYTLLVVEYNYIKSFMEVLMFGSNVLEVAMGLIFVYTSLSLLCSFFNEQVIVRFFQWRAKYLEEGINSMLNTIRDNSEEQELTSKDLYGHGLIQSMTRKHGEDKVKKPSYISSHAFALALKDVMTEKGIELRHIPALKPVWRDVEHNVEEQLVSIERWYDDTMDRVSGWYKRRTQFVIFLLSLTVTILLNIDTISMVTSLSNSSTLRAAYVSAAQTSAISSQTANSPANTNLASIINSIEQIQPVIGWSSFPLSGDLRFWIFKVTGLLATTLALSLGADFWFGLLKNFIRLSGSTPTPSGGTSGSKP
jgi:hypothetical protein